MDIDGRNTNGLRITLDLMYMGCVLFVLSTTPYELLRERSLKPFLASPPG